MFPCALLQVVTYKMSTTNWQCQLQIGTCHWHLPSISVKNTSFADSTVDFPHLFKGVQGVVQKWGTLCSGKTCRTDLQIVKCFQEPMLWAQVLYLLISGKVLKLFILLMTSRPSEKKICAWLHVLPLQHNHVYRLSSLPPWKSFSKLSEMLSPGIKHVWMKGG